VCHIVGLQIWTLISSFGDIVLFFNPGAVAAPIAVLAEPRGKQKKKGKKSGRTIQEEEDLDAILAELEGPSRSTPPTIEAIVAASASPEPIAAEEPEAVEKSLVAGAVLPEVEEVTESAASKKKKKKKEKEKAAKAGAGTVCKFKMALARACVTDYICMWDFASLGGNLGTGGFSTWGPGNT